MTPHTATTPIAASLRACPRCAPPATGPLCAACRAELAALTLPVEDALLMERLRQAYVRCPERGPQAERARKAVATMFWRDRRKAG